MVSNLLRTWLLASLFTAVTQASEPQTGTWGDQGDGTYRNPILNADYPDVDWFQYSYDGPKANTKCPSP